MYVDPESWLGLLLRLAGHASFVLVVGGTVAGLLIGFFARRRGNLMLARRAVLGAGVLVAAYATALLLGPIVLRGRTLGPGEELAFCGFDCHLHLSATHVKRDGGLSVTVRARSDAKAVPEDPRFVRLFVVDGRGVQYDADSMRLDVPLGPGESYERTLHFRVPIDASDLRLVGTWKGWAAYAIPGPDNALVQRQAGIALSAAQDVS